MLFNSTPFIFVFLPLVLIGYAALSRFADRRVAIAWLVMASLFYYGWWKWIYLALILISIVVNFGLGRVLSTTSGAAGRRLVLAAGITINLGLLAYFKYAAFLAATADGVLGTRIDLPPIVLPLAISFFTFQQIAYLVDVYLHQARATRFLDYCLFVTFFPQLIAGPIVLQREMMPQFTRRHRYRMNSSDMSIGLTMFTLGLAKKVLIADTCATWSTPIFELAHSGQTPTVLEAWAAVLGYSFQIYFDFSGYSDMAIGLGRMFGIRLPLNFFSPYKAASIIDFWRRWHITLSRFLRDYLYIPLGGNRRGRSRRYANLMVTMLLGGLWHGAGWTFVVWGALHGLYLMINHGWHAARGERLTSTVAGRIASTAVTFLAVLIAWVFFRAASFEAASRMLSAMFGGAGFEWQTRLDIHNASIWIVLLPVLVWLMPNTQQLMGRFRPAMGYSEHVGCPNRKSAWSWRPNPALACATSALLLYTIWHVVSERSEFIYYQF